MLALFAQHTQLTDLIPAMSATLTVYALASWGF